MKTNESNTNAPIVSETKLSEAISQVLPEKKDSKALTEIKDAVSELRAKATPTDVATAAAIVASGQAPRVITLTPEVAACILVDHNHQNRSLSPPRVHGYADDMGRGEWKLNHQGLAFYPDGSLADGQHRTYGVALSGKEQRFLVSNDFDQAAIDTIDRSTRRSAGEALEMLGVVDGKDKASIMKTVKNYCYKEEFATTPRFTDPQIEAAVLEHESLLTEAIAMGKASLSVTANPPLHWKEVATMSALFLIGGWPKMVVDGWITSIQKGQDNYPESPATLLSSKFMDARISDAKTKRLSKEDKLALSIKGAKLWVNNTSVARLTFDRRKETLPTHAAPEMPNVTGTKTAA